jgi:septum formation protein
MSRVILASQSPRRKKLLTQMGVDFAVIPSDYDEHLDDARSPETVAIELALGKAMAVAEQYPDDIVIGSDTIVTVHGKQLAKAADDKEAEEMLRLLSGTHNEVTTGVAVIRLSDNFKLTGADAATVYFHQYDEELVRRYIDSGDYKDKAGAYGVQSGAAPLIDYFVGNYDTVLGLPAALLSEFLAKVGIIAKPIKLEAPVEQRQS